MVHLLQCNIGIAEQSNASKYSKDFQVLTEFNLFNKRLAILRLSKGHLENGKKCISDDVAERDVFESSKIMFCCTTSGSTGKPKMVQVPFKCVMPNVLSLRYDEQ